VPASTPVTTPEVALIVALVTSLLLQTPPVGVLVRFDVLAAHTVAEPLITGSARTINEAVLKQPPVTE
jgi:hypothetical protein